jgi:hypothetical protein
MPTKIAGKPVYSYQGLDIYVNPQPAKTKRGKHRVWIHIRQEDPRLWEEDEALNYVQSADIRFKKTQTPPAQVGGRPAGGTGKSEG